MAVTNRVKALQVEAFEIGFNCAMRGYGLDEQAATLAERMPRLNPRDYPAVGPSLERGFDAGLEFLVALGGRERAAVVLADGGKLREAAHESHKKSLLSDEIPHNPLEPCADCHLIAGCAATGWACESFRRYVSRSGTRGVRPRSVPDGPFDFGAH